MLNDKQLNKIISEWGNTPLDKRESITGLCRRVADAAEAAERERCENLLELQQASYEREIQIEVAAERERCARIVETQDTYGDSVGCWFETLAAKIRA